MGRRKQGSTPTKNLGLVEHRHHGPQTSLPPLPLEDLPPWLQEEPDEAPLARKRRKFQQEAETSLPIRVPPFDKAVLTLGTIDMAIKGDNAALDAYTLKLSTESILGSNSVVHTLLHEADDVDTDCTIAGTCTLPAAAGMALHRLVKNGMVTLQPTPPPSFSSAPLDGTCAVVITDAAVLQELPHPSMPPSKGPSTRTPLSPRKASLRSNAGAEVAAAASFDAAELYTAIRPPRDAPEHPTTIPGLLPQLRTYQSQAVAWMVRRELGTAAVDGKDSLHPLWRAVHCCSGGATLYANVYSGVLSAVCPDPPAPVLGGILADEMGLGKTVELLGCILANPMPAVKEEQRPDAAATAPPGPCVCGSVSVPSGRVLWLQCDGCESWFHASCLGIRRAPPEEEGWVCPRCTRLRSAAPNPAQAKTTLIICPASILHQWEAEIRRHTADGALSVLVFEGQPQNPEDSHLVTTPGDLAQYDVVLTTYEVLRQELHTHQAADAAGATRGRRTAQRYHVIPTALPLVNFWRICLDEAQEVESGTTGAAKLALQLTARHRWGVTGTPISRGAEDLYGLLAFLRADPFDDKGWWDRVLQRPYESGDRAARARLLRLLCPVYPEGLMWRNAKADVAVDLGIPQQHALLTQLQFNAIERHWYQRQHQDCIAHVWAVLPAKVKRAVTWSDLPSPERDQGPTQQGAPGPTKKRKAAPTAAQSDSAVAIEALLPPAKQRKLLEQLVKLRQACCHPQVGAGGVRALEASARPMFMDEVLEYMITQATTEAEEEQRKAISAMNGLAGLHILEHRLAEAVQLYRTALQLAASNAPLIRADPLQRLHTLHNLAQLLGTDSRGVPGVVPTLRDATLQVDADKIRDEYVAKFTARMAVTAADLETLRRDMQSKLQDGGVNEDVVSAWHIGAAQLIAQHTPDDGEGCVKAVRDALQESDTYNRLTDRNAVSMADRVRHVLDLRHLLDRHIQSNKAARDAALATLDSLHAQCTNPDMALVQQAGSCSRCRAETGVRGRVCAHCKLDERFMEWEMVLYFIRVKSMQQGKQVTMMEALAQRHVQALKRVGQGGLNEVGMEEALGGAEETRRGQATGVTTANIVTRASEAEQAMTVLLSQLKQMRLPQGIGAQRDALVSLGDRHLKAMELERRVFIKARALSLAQRLMLYARDELEMATLRLQLRLEGEAVTLYETHYKLHEAEIPARNHDFTNDRLVAEATLTTRLGTLRYLKQLQTTRRQALGAAPASAEGEQQSMCPVCHEALGRELVMLSCGHQLCAPCSMKMLEKLPKQIPKHLRRINCPTCRAVIYADNMAFVRTAGGVASPHLAAGAGPSSLLAGPRGGPSSEQEGPSEARDSGVRFEGRLCRDSHVADEASIAVQGQYGSKVEAVVRRVCYLLSLSPESRVLVFSTWRDVLAVIAHALQLNGVPHLFPAGGGSGTFAHDVAIFRNLVAHTEQYARKGKQTRAARGKKGGLGGGHPPRVLLLMTKQGGKGLNLTEAQHVVLAEPQLDPASEAQAVNRVHRIGQREETWVHRFVVDRTVEENVHRLVQQRAAAMNLSAAAVSKRGAADEKSLTVRDIAMLLRSD